jgi:hypothetical protein
MAEFVDSKQTSYTNKLDIIDPSRVKLHPRLDSARVHWSILVHPDIDTFHPNRLVSVKENIKFSHLLQKMTIGMNIFVRNDYFTHRNSIAMKK